MPLLRAFLVLLVGSSPDVVHAQAALSAGASVDTVISWGSYAATRRARVRMFAADDSRRPRTIVVDDMASNEGLVTDEVRFFAETAGRSLRFDPAEATFVFRYSAASFTVGADDEGRRLLLRATFRRADSGDLGPPAWRVITSDALEDLTSRQLR
jgi:hypothetical protein